MTDPIEVGPSHFVPTAELLDSPVGRSIVAIGAPTPRWRRPPRRTELAVIGGGLGAISLGSHLWHAGLRDFVIIDPAHGLGSLFFDRVARLGQRVLRSPYQHHLGAFGDRDCELLDFARCAWPVLTTVERREIRRAQAGQRSVVPVDLFAAYTHQLIRNHGLHERHVRDSVTGVRALPQGGGYEISLRDGMFEAASVVWATGHKPRSAPEEWRTDEIPWHDWTRNRRPVESVMNPEDKSAAVIGAGVSAAHILDTLRRQRITVHWIIRADAERYQCTDVDARFFRPEGRAAFELQAVHERSETLKRERGASVMLEFQSTFREWERSRGLVVHRGTSVAEIRPSADGAVLHLSERAGVRPAQVAVNRVFGALGLRPVMPGVPDGVDFVGGRPQITLECELQSLERGYVMGDLAGLAIGPAAANIDGLRVAAERIVRAELRRRNDA